MENYTIGQKLSRRILNIHNNNFIVSLDPDHVGIVRYGAAKSSAQKGDMIDVVVKEFIGADIYLDLDEHIEEAAQDDQYSYKQLSWNDWEDIPTGHKQAKTALVSLRSHADDFRRELISARKDWESAKEKNQKNHASIVNGLTHSFESKAANFKKDLDNTKANAQKEREDNIARIGRHRNTAQQITSYCSSFVDSVRRSNISSAINVAVSNMTDVRKRADALNEAVEATFSAYRTLCSAKIAKATETYNEKLANAERERNAGIDRSKNELNELNSQADRKFKARYNSICDQNKADIEKGFSKASIHAYQQKIKSSMFNPVNYECVTEVPEYVMLGNIGLVIPGGTQDDVPVVHAVDAQADEVGTKQGSDYVVKIPYAQRLSDGISLLMRYSPADREYIQSMMQPLLLKLFMSFPAGKLEATMIDPLELGASFPDIPKLAPGDKAARIINGKIWSKEKDIEMVIATLRQDLENMMQSYGKDQESRLNKESIKVLAITDFPVNFTEAALKDLHAIVRNSAYLGICVLISANEAELSRLKDRNGILVSEITQNVIETVASGKRLRFAGPDMNNIFLELDEMEKTMENLDTILPVIASGIEHRKGKVESFDDMFKGDIHDSNNWFTGNHEEISIPIGIKGADTVVDMVLGRTGGNTEHHALVSGMTGAGKSTFLHTLIMSTLVTYSPDEVQMYLLDFKEGVEFSAYTRYRLPSLRVVAINSEREFGLNVLKELDEELENRTAKFQREVGTTEINDYRKKPNAEKVPKLLLIFDEIQELFRSEGNGDSISAECISLIQRLVTQGRAVGIHVILACQDFTHCAGLNVCFSQMAVRIAIKGSIDGASSILKSGNEVIQKLLEKGDAGAAIYNGKCGEESANNVFQISYIGEEERLQLLEELDKYFTDPEVASLYEEKETRVLLTNAENDIHNCFNRFILEGIDGVEPLGSTKDGYGLLLGQGFGDKSVFIPEFRRKKGDNLMVVTHEEKMAISLFEYAAMSVLYEELHTKSDKANALIYLIDQSDKKLPAESCTFAYFESVFPQQVKIGKKGDAEDIIASVYNILQQRSEGTMPSDERIFFMYFGINRAKQLAEGNLYNDENESELSPVEMLQRIFSDGPAYGINSIVWGESPEGISSFAGDRYMQMFKKRIAYELDEKSMKDLVDEHRIESLSGKTAVYYDVLNDNTNTHFRPYDIPAKVWIEEYGRKYDETVNGGGV